MSFEESDKEKKEIPHEINESGEVHFDAAKMREFFTQMLKKAPETDSEAQFDSDDEKETGQFNISELGSQFAQLLKKQKENDYQFLEAQQMEAASKERGDMYVTEKDENLYLKAAKEAEDDEEEKEEEEVDDDLSEMIALAQDAFFENRLSDANLLCNQILEMRPNDEDVHTLLYLIQRELNDLRSSVLIAQEWARKCGNTQKALRGWMESAYLYGSLESMKEFAIAIAKKNQSKKEPSVMHLKAQAAAILSDVGLKEEAEVVLDSCAGQEIPDEYAVVIDSLTLFAEASLGKENLIQDMTSSALLLPNIDYACFTAALACAYFFPLRTKASKKTENEKDEKEQEKPKEIPQFVLEALALVEKKKKEKAKEDFEVTDPNIVGIQCLRQNDAEKAKSVNGANIIIEKRLKELINQK